MKRKTANILKAVIISVCVAIVAASAIVGIVLLTKKDPAPPKVAYKLSQEQKDLLGVINTDSKELASQLDNKLEIFDDSLFIDNNGDSIELENFLEIKDGSFSVLDDENNTSVYIYVADENGNRSSVNLLTYLKSQELAEDNAEYVAHTYLNNGFISFCYQSQTEGYNYNLKYMLIDSSDASNIKVLSTVSVYRELHIYYDSNDNIVDAEYEFTYDTNKSFYECKFSTVSDDFIAATVTYAMGDIDYTRYIIQDMAGESSQTLDIETDKINNVSSNQKAFSVSTTDGTQYIVYYKDSMKKHVIDLSADDVVSTYTTIAGTLIEIAEPVQTLADRKPTSVLTNADRYFNYSYKFFNYSTGKLTNVSLSKGYSKINVKNASSDYVVLYQQKVDEEFKIIADDVRFSYYSSDFEKMFEYDANSVSNTVVYAQGNKFVTLEGIYEIIGKTKTSLKVSFAEKGYTLLSDKITSNILVVRIKALLKTVLIDLNGNLIVNVLADNIFDYGYGNFIAEVMVSNDEIDYYLIDANKSKEQAATLIDDFYFDDLKINVGLVSSNLGYYFTKDDADVIKMFDYKGTQITFDEKITGFSRVAISAGSYLKVDLVTESKYFYTGASYTLEMQEEQVFIAPEESTMAAFSHSHSHEEESNNSPSLYETQGTSATVGSGNCKIEHSTYNGWQAIKVTMNNGVYIDKLKINFWYKDIGYNPELHVKGELSDGKYVIKDMQITSSESETWIGTYDILDGEIHGCYTSSNENGLYTSTPEVSGNSLIYYIYNKYPTCGYKDWPWSSACGQQHSFKFRDFTSDWCSASISQLGYYAQVNSAKDVTGASFYHLVTNNPNSDTYYKKYSAQTEFSIPGFGGSQTMEVPYWYSGSSRIAMNSVDVKTIKGSTYLGLSPAYTSEPSSASTFYNTDSSNADYGQTKMGADHPGSNKKTTIMDLLGSAKGGVSSDDITMYNTYFTLGDEYATNSFDNKSLIYNNGMFGKRYYFVALYKQNEYNIKYEINKPDGNINDSCVTDNNAASYGDDRVATYRFMQSFSLKPIDIDNYTFSHWEIEYPTEETTYKRYTNGDEFDFNADSDHSTLESMTRIAHGKKQGETTKMQIKFFAHYIACDMYVDFQFYNNSDKVALIKTVLTTDAEAFANGNTWTFSDGSSIIELTESSSTKQYSYTKEDGTSANVSSIKYVTDGTNDYFLYSGTTNSYVKSSESFNADTEYYIIRRASIQAPGATLSVSVTGKTSFTGYSNGYYNGETDGSSDFPYAPRINMSEIFGNYNTSILNSSTAKNFLVPDNIATIGSGYQFLTWGLYLGATTGFTTSQANGYTPFSCQNASPIEYLQTYTKNISMTEGGHIVAYAIFEAKEYFITREKDDSYGSHVYNKSSSTKDKQLTESTKNAITNANVINETNISSNIIIDMPSETFYLQTVQIKITIDNKTNSVDKSNPTRYYIFDKVVVSNLGYMYSPDGGYNYGSTSLTFTFSGNSCTLSSPATIRKASDNSVLSDTSTAASANVEFYLGQYSSGDIQFNTFKIVSISSTEMVLQVKFLGVCGAWYADGNTSNAPHDFKEDVTTNPGFAVTLSTATGNRAGFTIKPYAKSNYTRNDTYYATATAGDSGTNGSGVVQGMNIQDTYVVSDSRIAFSINNLKCIIPTFTSGDGSGFYTFSSSSKETVADIVYYKFIKKTTDLPSLNSAFPNNTIYFDGRFVYYPSSFDSIGSSNNVTQTINGSNINTNFNNTKVVAIRPDQNKVYAAKESHSAVQKSYYELTSFLYSISFNDSSSTSHEFYLERDYQDVSSVATYRDFNFRPSSSSLIDYIPSSGSSINKTISYLGQTYKIYQAFAFSTTKNSFARYYVLYLTRNESNTEIMYFLYSDIYAQTVYADNLANNHEITFTFKELNNTITLTMTHDDEDKFNTNDIPLIYRYGYAGAATNNVSTFTTSGLARNTASGSPTPKNFFGLTSNKYNSVGSVIYYNKPSDYVVFEFQPTDGYIIKNIAVNIDGTDFELFRFDYDYSTLYTVNGHLTYTSAGGGETNTRFFYDGPTSNSYFRSFYANEGTNDQFYGGIMFSNSCDSGVTRSDFWRTSYGDSYFNPIWIMVSGMYNDVSISVETMSLLELVITDTSNKLQFKKNGDDFIDIEKLSILYGTGAANSITWHKLDFVEALETEWFKISNISNQNSMYRLIFEGNAELFKHGLQIYASDTNYTYSFTAGKLYYDKTTVTGSTSNTGKFFENLQIASGDFFTGRTTAGGTLYNNALVNAEGVGNATLELSKKFLHYSDIATYLYIKDVRRVSTVAATLDTGSINYESTTYANVRSSDQALEFNNKYIFAFTVGDNLVTYETNSYLYNKNISAVTSDYDKVYEVEVTSKASNTELNVADASKIKVGMLATILNSSKSTVVVDNPIVKITGKKLKFKNSVADVDFEDNETYTCQFIEYQYDSTNKTSNKQFIEDTTKRWQWKIEDNVFACYQLDYYIADYYSKKESWFNNTTLSNIDFGYDLNNNPLKWQTLGLNAGNLRNSFNAEGYGISYKYKEIPGYYLNYIELVTVDYGRIYIDVTGINSKSGKKIKTKLFTPNDNAGNHHESDNTGIYYEVEYKVNSTDGGYFIFRVYNSSTNVSAGAWSVGLLSNNFKVNFYSRPYEYRVEFDANTGNSSSTATMKAGLNAANRDSTVQDFSYDTIAAIEPYMVMDGYTFIGWASYGNNSGSYTITGHDGATNTWNTQSSWISINNLFAHNQRENLLKLKDLETVYNSSDFYVKNNANKTGNIASGYFITDTGISLSNDKDQETYNFWSVYSDMFTANIGAYNPHPENPYVNEELATLFAVWKANTYVLKFDVNDVTSSSNGSTEHSMNVNLTDTQKTTLFGGNANNPFDDSFTNNNISFNLTVGAASDTTKTYYCFIRFDSDDWYITQETSALDSKYSYYDLNIAKWGNVLDSDNELNIVIDRYGYSWLGWFFDVEDNIKEESITSAVRSSRVFGSEYYYAKVDTTATKESKLPVFDNTLYGKFLNKGSIPDDGTIYTRFVYNGQHKVDETLDEDSYVYFYDYKTVTSGGYYTNNDYLNHFTETKGRLTCFDTSLTYECYSYSSSKVSISRSITSGSAAIRYLTLHSYWQINYYSFVIDWQDNNVENLPSENVMGSTPSGLLHEGNLTKTEFKDYIKNTTYAKGLLAADFDKLDEYFRVEDGKNVLKSYFDDDNFSNVLNNFTPVRVGYDFLGWTYYNFKDDSNNTKPYTDQNIPMFTNVGGLNTHFDADISTALWLCEELTSSYDGKIPLYTDKLCITNGDYDQKTETFGSDRTSHYCYIYAVWQPQTFTINVDLNIELEELENLYEKDSRFAVALYKNNLNELQNKVSNDYDNYTGIRTNYYKFSDDVYTEIIANVNFVIDFDKSFNTAYLTISYKQGNNTVTEKYYLDNLFATSTGYYLLGWLYDPFLANPNEYSTNALVYNTLKSTFDVFVDNSTVGVHNVNNYNIDVPADGGRSYVTTTNSQFNFTMYKKLYNTDYKVRTLNESYSDPTEMYGADKFAGSGNNITLLKDNDKHGASSNFGYLTINEENCYIACEDKVVGGVLTHTLYFKYLGFKYYVIMYDTEISEDNILKSDHSFLYLVKDGVKYKVRYDTSGKPYIIDTNYGSPHWLDIKLAIFRVNDPSNHPNQEAKNLVTYTGSKIIFYYRGRANNTFKVGDVIFTPETTRQFTIYGHWLNKNDFNININNGNNTGTASNSNPGLAGFFDVTSSTNYNTSNLHYSNSFTSNGNVKTENNAVDTLNLVYNYHDDIDINILPFYNGRFLSKLSFTFYSVDENEYLSTDDTSMMRTKFVTSKYTVVFKFVWDSENHKIVLKSEGGVTYFVNASDGKATVVPTETNGNNYTLKSLSLGTAKNTSRLSLLDREVFSDYFMRVFEYSDGTSYNAMSGYLDDKDYTFDRKELNKIVINMDDLMSQIDITCEFSVQTYDLKFYSVLDPEGFNLKLQANTTNKYETGFHSKEEFTANVETNNQTNADGTSAAGTYFSASKYDSTNLATIPQDCAAVANPKEASEFNVPYGYFIYGQFYTSAFYPNRPVDDVNVTPILNEDMYGFEYIYSNSYYNYGITDLIIEADGEDSFYAQCSPVLGPNYRFSQANGFRKQGLSFYTFDGWYEYDESQPGKVVFVAYDRTAESTYINRDIVLYGYYYTFNTPTSIEFYTWNDSSESYIPYTGNANQYTLTANLENAPFYASSNILVLNQNSEDYRDADNIAKIKTYNKYGVDSSRFGNDQFSSFDFSPQADTDKNVLERLLQTYWYYDDYYLALYKMIGTTKHYIRYDGGFYYLSNESNIYSSRVSVNIYTADDENYYIEGDLANELGTEILYKYDFDGAYLYIKETANTAIPGDRDKYYRVYEVTDAMISKAEAGTYGTSGANAKESNFLKKYKPRYYYDQHGMRYYLLPTTDAPSGDPAANTIYWVNKSASGDGVTADSTDMTTIVKNYYVNYDGEYYTVHYAEYTDAQGSKYISPMHDPKTNTVTVPGGEGGANVDCYLNYDTKTLYNMYTGERVSFSHYIYCPINENYQVNVENTNGTWLTDAITIKSLPSPNIGFWYNGDDYGFVGYIMVTDKLIEEMRKAPSNDGSDDGGIIYRTFKSYMELVYSKDNFNKTRFSDYDLQTGTSALYNKFIQDYSAGTGNFDKAYEEFYRILNEKVGDEIANYTDEDLKSSLILAERYEYSQEGLKNVISGVVVNIPIEFRDVMTDPRTDAPLNMIVTIKPENPVMEPFKMISVNTSVEENIYAIPIYSPYLVQFNQSTVTSAAKDGSGNTTVLLDIEEMDVWHFELGSDSSYAYSKANGDLLNFIVLDYDQYTDLNNNKANIAEYLSTIVKGMSDEDKAKYIFTENSDTNISDVEISLNGLVGHYVVLAYYNKSGITNASESYVVRVSDNLIHLDIAAGGVSYEITTMGNVMLPD